MDTRPPRIPLEYWITFKTVVDAGSYVQAGELLNKSQSSVSYSIARLNELLPRPVLALRGRRAELTNEGQVLYRYATQLVNQARTMEDLARAMVQEFEAEVVIALDVLVRIDQLCCSLADFSRRFPHTRVRVLESSLSGTTEALLEKQANLVIGASIPVGYSGTPLLAVRMLPVAAPSHPLFRHQRISDTELRAYRQVVLRDTGQRRQQDSGWLEAEQRWTVSHFSSSVSLIRSGLAFGFLPDNWVRTELDQGSLQEIPLEGHAVRELPLYLMHAARETEGPATRGLAELLARDLADPAMR